MKPTSTSGGAGAKASLNRRGPRLVLVHGKRERPASRAIADAIASALAEGSDARPQPTTPPERPSGVARLRPKQTGSATVRSAVTLIAATAASFGIGFVAVGLVLLGLPTPRSVHRAMSAAPGRSSPALAAGDAVQRDASPFGAHEAPVTREHRQRTGPIFSRDGYGNVELRAATRGHRVYVDGRNIPRPQPTMTLPCGRHVVRIGSHGADRRVDVPCGGTTLVADP